MAHIVAGIHSLPEYLDIYHNRPDCLIPEHCPYCGYNVLAPYGFYNRQSHRENDLGHSLNPIPIRRFHCKNCKRTCSSLPECIPPRRWYIWSTQQECLQGHLEGESLETISNKVRPSLKTIHRWLTRLKEQFLQHLDQLKQQLPELGRLSGFAEVWRSCLSSMRLSQAMLILHEAGIPVP